MTVTWYTVWVTIVTEGTPIMRNIRELSFTTVRNKGSGNELVKNNYYNIKMKTRK